MVSILYHHVKQVPVVLYIPIVFCVSGGWVPREYVAFLNKSYESLNKGAKLGHIWINNSWLNSFQVLYYFLD